MKDIKFLLIIALYSYLLTFTNNAYANQCTEPGLPNGSECHFIDCECTSDVCVNGRCVQCATDSDCQNSTCVDNICQ